jgi:tetratricopeptide (TPR) repeat protein
MIAPATPDAFTMAWRRRSATTISACTRIIESDKETPQGRADALTRRAEFHRIGDRFDQAIADCDAALQLDPNYAPAYAGRSQVYRRKGDLLRAMADADKAVALKPSDPRGYDVRGTAHRENGDLDSAIAEYTSAIERDPTYVWPYYNRGFTYAKKGDFAVAIADYGKVIALDATITAAFTQRGVAYEAIGNSTEAVRDYRDALRIPKKHTTGEWRTKRRASGWSRWASNFRLPPTIAHALPERPAAMASRFISPGPSRWAGWSRRPIRSMSRRRQRRRDGRALQAPAL